MAFLLLHAILNGKLPLKDETIIFNCNQVSAHILLYYIGIQSKGISKK
jgi:hypothetical protein